MLCQYLRPCLLPGSCPNRKGIFEPGFRYFIIELTAYSWRRHFSYVPITRLLFVPKDHPSFGQGLISDCFWMVFILLCRPLGPRILLLESWNMNIPFELTNYSVRFVKFIFLNRFDIHDETSATVSFYSAWLRLQKKLPMQLYDHCCNEIQFWLNRHQDLS